jgi:hypothetical protein
MEPMVVLARRHRRAVVRSVARFLGFTLTLFVIYAIAPVDHKSTEFWAVMKVALAFVALVGVTGWQIFAISRSPYPRLRAFEAIGISVPLLVLVFAAVYVSMAAYSAQNFNQPITKIDGVYFTVTALATVGFGDIVAVSETARVIVTVQMIVDLIFIGVVAKVLVGVTQRRVAELEGAGVVLGSDSAASGDGGQGSP